MLNGIDVFASNKCVITNTTAQLDVIYYAEPVTCGGSIDELQASAEISIPPLSPIPASCVPTYQCLRVTTRQPLSSTLGLPASVVQASSVAFASVSNLRVWGNNSVGQLGIGSTTQEFSR